MKARILVVDDEQPIVSLLTKILDRLGYMVYKTTIGSEALSLYKSMSDKIDLVLSDITMPGLNGIYLSKEILKHDPDAKIILMTGFSSTTLEDVKRIGVKELIYKPIFREDLNDVIQTVLNMD